MLPAPEKFGQARDQVGSDWTGRLGRTRLCPTAESTQTSFGTERNLDSTTLTIPNLTMPPQNQTAKTATTRQPNTNRRGTRRSRGQGDTPRGDTPRNQEVSPPPQAAQQIEDTTQDETEELGSEDGSCWICAEPVKYYSVSECNHRTCHTCALRLRALYKKSECIFCKVSSASTYNPCVRDRVC